MIGLLNILKVEYELKYNTRCIWYNVSDKPGTVKSLGCVRLLENEIFVFPLFQLVKLINSLTLFNGASYDEKLLNRNISSRTVRVLREFMQKIIILKTTKRQYA